MPEEKKSGDAFTVLFPNEEVKICEGKTVKVHPLALSDLPKVLEAFNVIRRLAEKGMPPSEIALSAGGELLKILPFCIDRRPEEIPVTLLPDILEIVLKQNITDVSVAKWKALIQRVLDQFPTIKKVSPVDQSLNSQK